MNCYVYLILATVVFLWFGFNKFATHKVILEERETAEWEGFSIMDEL